MYIPFWIIIIAVAVIFIIYKSKNKVSSQISSINTNTIKDDKYIPNYDSVVQIQKDFEKKIELSYLPDRIQDRDTYIYKNLMLPWYNELINKNHYNTEITKKITADWINYIKALEEEANCRCLYKLNFESENEQETNSYIEEGRIAMQKANEIEKQFASSIGDDALKKLSYARNIDDEKIPQMLLKTNIKERLNKKE
ncbi:MAG: hypothetical protein Q7J14_02255 [Candidatus Magasanikbacteria bacterium]|nr:hypothetical protein [Candidatus Magasanikbacteria bacterium]